jgi:hypothetical protein
MNLRLRPLRANYDRSGQPESVLPGGGECGLECFLISDKAAESDLSTSHANSSSACVVVYPTPGRHHNAAAGVQ